MRFGYLLGAGVMLAMFALARHPASAASIDFDDVASPASGQIFPGTQYAAQGITFTSGNAPAGLNVGDTFVFGSPTNTLLILGNSGSISAPNFAAAADVFGTNNDVLMSFAVPTVSLSLMTDDSPAEAADVVRLLALAATSNLNEYKVVAITSGADNAVTAPDNTLFLTLPGGFSFAIFERTTEAEGFDNVTFDTRGTVPEPATFALLGGALLGLGLRRRLVKRLD